MTEGATMESWGLEMAKFGVLKIMHLMFFPPDHCFTTDNAGGFVYSFKGLIERLGAPEELMAEIQLMSDNPNRFAGWLRHTSILNRHKHEYSVREIFIAGVYSRDFYTIYE